jgi:hypothetical protein
VVQIVKDGDTVATAYDRFTIQDQGPCAYPNGSARDRRIAAVRAATGEQPHRVTVPAHDQPVSVVLDLVHPVRTPVGGLAASLGMQGETNPSVRTRAFI